MTSLLLRVWRLIRGPLQWYVLWFFHNKFIVGVSGVVCNKDGKVLLLRHRFWLEGSWGLPSGYANKGEKLEDALAREVREETGLAIQVSRFLNLKSGFRLRIEVTYAARVTGGQFQLDPKEVIQAAFFTLNELPNGLLPSHREAISESGAQAR